MNFQQSVKYLYCLGNEVTAMKLGLETTEKLLAALDNPERKFLKIQIAGTNGKGSTCAFLDAICRSAKVETGLFTSPHLISITERIKINGAEISEKDFAEHATKVRRVSENLLNQNEIETVPTFFEQMTAIAVSAFAAARIELAILETGLGGRYDSVTATRAEIAAITPIDFDHQQILGNTLTEIASEKAAIIRADTGVFVAPQLEEARRVIAESCRTVGVQPVWATENIQVGKLLQKTGFSALSGDFTTKKDSYFNIVLGLNGRHQFVNASLAISIAENLSEKGFAISANDIRAGLQQAEHRGRLEFYGNILFDGAHNAAGAQALKNYLDEFINVPITLIFGAMREKDISEMAAHLFTKADRLIFTKADNSRSMEPSEFLSLLPQYKSAAVFTANDVNEALAIAREITPENHLILVTGSLYLVGEAQKLLNNKSEI